MLKRGLHELLQFLRDVLLPLEEQFVYFDQFVLAVTEDLPVAGLA
jgi:hypothetical protein